MQVNCNFITMVGLTNKLFDSQSVCGDTPGFRKNYENVFECMSTFKLRVINSKCNVISIQCFAVCMALY